MSNHGSRHPRPVDDASYIAFMAAALVLALGAGLVLAVLVSLAPALGWRVEESRLVQAHGWVQLEGWLGLVVAGMSLRLVPRLCHRPPLPPALALTLLGFMTSGAILRLVGQVDLLPGSLALLLPGAALAAAGMLGLAGALARVLGGPGEGASRPEAWRWAVWAAAAWWAGWAALTLVGGLLAARDHGLVPPSVDGTAVWVAALGAVGNVIWAVQARTVPVFYGRRPPGRLGVPLLIYNLGAVFVLASAATHLTGVRQVGLALAGAGLLWMTPVAGSVRGTAHRLREPSRAAARFIVAANRWAMVAGACLLAGAASSVWAAGTVAAELDDAALHGLGLGLATTLIVGMARLVTPVFAIGRALPDPRRHRLDLTWTALMAATTLRLAAALLQGVMPGAWEQGLLASSGVLAWLALALFAASLARAWSRQGRLRSELARAALRDPQSGG